MDMFTDFKEGLNKSINKLCENTMVEWYDKVQLLKKTIIKPNRKWKHSIRDERENLRPWNKK